MKEEGGGGGGGGGGSGGVRIGCLSRIELGKRRGRLSEEVKGARGKHVVIGELIPQNS